MHNEELIITSTSRTSSYSTRTLIYFANIPMFCLRFPQCFSVISHAMVYAGNSLPSSVPGLIILINHFISMWMPLNSIVTHCIDFVMILFVLLYCLFVFVVCWLFVLYNVVASLLSFFCE